MAENQKDQFVVAPPNTYSRIDEEDQAKEIRRKKRTKCFTYIAIFAVFQTAIILLFALTIMKVGTPKFRVRTAIIETLDAPITNPSFNIRMNVEIGVKNTNFGHYKYENSNITFFYRDIPVGNAIVVKSRAKARSTKKFNIVVDLNSSNLPGNSGLGIFLSSGFLPLTSRSRLRGKVEIMKMMKKNKSTEMRCTLVIDIMARELRNVNCK